MSKELKPKRKGNYHHNGNKTHGLFKNNKSLFNLWQTIKTRCNNPKRNNYKNYGGRGITLCTEWEKAENFVRWALDNGYKKGLQIDRIDNNAGYSPDNCRFITCKENSNNKRNSVRFTIEGKELTAKEISQKYGVSIYSMYYWRRTLGNNQAVAKAISAWNRRK